MMPTALTTLSEPLTLDSFQLQAELRGLNANTATPVSSMGQGSLKHTLLAPHRVLDSTGLGWV